MTTTVKFGAEVTRETAKALCVHLNGDSIDHWIVRSQIQPGSEVRHRGDCGALIVSDWFAYTARLPIGEELTMPYEQRPNSGQLFLNRKRKNDNAPNLKGSGLLELEDGHMVELDIAAWTKESPKAGKWLSLTIKVKQARDGQNAGHEHFNQRVAEASTPMDDDIPF
jgi:hypothetical protein